MLLEINYELFGFRSILSHVVCHAPFCQSLKFISVSWFISSRDESNYGHVICKFDDGIGRMDGSAVMSKKDIEKWTQHTALWDTCTQS